MPYEKAYQRWKDLGFEEIFNESTKLLDTNKAIFKSIHDLDKEKVKKMEPILVRTRNHCREVGEHRRKLIDVLNSLRREELRISQGEVK